MTMILLHNPIASDPALERVHMFPGRHLGEEEFDRQQAYADARLAPLLKTANAGIVYGLTLGNHESDAVIVVNPGLAVAANGQTLNLHMPLRLTWQDLIEQYLASTATSEAAGLYDLILHQRPGTMDAPGVEPCQRTEFDPTRDSRLVTVTTLALRRLAIDPAVLAASARSGIENQVAAARVDGRFLAQHPNTVPLALLAIDTVDDRPQVTWLSQAAGRYPALPGSGYRVLLNQSLAAMSRAMQEHRLAANQATPLADFLRDNLQLNYLPAAGQFPVEWLQQPDATAPNLLWLPEHLGVDMIPVPETAVSHLLERHLPGRLINLRQVSDDRLRLLVALKPADYRPDLLDIPPPDARLGQDIYRYYMHAYNAWRRWREQFDALYFVAPSGEDPLAGPEDLVNLEHRVLDPLQFKHLDLPRPIAAPIAPGDLFQNLIREALRELQEPGSEAVPYPYNQAVPAPPEAYTNWLVPVEGGGVPPAVPTAEQDGLVIQYAVALVELEAIENQIRALRSRLEKTRDFLLLERQQLDSQTVSLASLAGGVAGDGQGLQVARWLPYASFDTSLLPEEIDKGTTAATALPSGSSRGVRSTISPADGAGINKGISNDLISNAISKSSGNKLSFLSMKPQTFSAFELGINKQRLNLLSNVAREAISKPAFAARELRFGVLEHISPEVNEYTKAYYGLQDLKTTLNDLFDTTDAAHLRKQLNAVTRNSELADPNALEDQITRAATRDGVVDQHLRGLLGSQKRYDALFRAGKVITQWIAICEARYNRIERQLQGKLREHTRQQALIEKLEASIRVAREKLDGLDRQFDEQVGDYGVAQLLLAEDWRQVHDRFLERARILTTAIQGLYYVRVRSTHVTETLADPLSLRHRDRSDLVPGCGEDNDAELPEALQPFFDAVAEIPLDDWAGLKELIPRLPPIAQFETLEIMRKARFQARRMSQVKATPGTTQALQARLFQVRQQTGLLLQQWSTTTLPQISTSVGKTQQESAKVLSLEDITANVSGPMRTRAQTLRQRLELCQACLLEKLNLLSGSLRLQWGQLAEDDRIAVATVARWPGLERAEQQDFNTTRTIAELIDWWFRQLSTDASSASNQAMRNMIRATLIFASLGDPREIIRGQVFLPPRLTKVGERFRVKLNRTPVPGTQLQLLDHHQQVCALLTVEDHSPDSTEVRLANVLQHDVKIDTRFSVAGKARKLI